jgi:phosphoglycerol transferase
MLPFSCLVAIKIVKGEILSETGSWRNKQFYQSMLISFVCAFTGFYYAFFTCIIYAVAIVIRLVNIHKDKIKRELSSLFLIICVALGCVVNIIPNIVYWLNNGINGSSETATRNIGDAEWYGLKFIQMILPRTGHRISLLSDLTQKYVNNYPMVNENQTATLGVVATIGFIISVIWLLNINKKDKTLSYFNICLFAIATVGGVGSVFSLLVYTPMRAYNRMSLVIMFISLLCIAEVLSVIKQKCNKWVFSGILVVVLVVGVFDQTVDYSPWDYTLLDSDRQFVSEIEEELPEGSMVFELPYVNWPSGGNYRMFIGYLESDTLHWSYGAMQGREEAQWQQTAAESDTATMLDMLEEQGYSGIYLDKEVYISIYGEEQFVALCDELTSQLGYDPIVSEQQNLYFWNMEAMQ